MAVSEGGGVGGVGEDFIGSGSQVPTYSLQLTEEVTPVGVGIHEAGYPWHRRHIWPGIKGAVGDLFSGAVRETGGGTPE